MDKVKDTLRVFVVPVDIFNVPDLTIYEQMAYIVIRSHCNPRGENAFPSYTTIAREGRMSRTSSIQSVKKLEEKGLISKEGRLRVTKDKKVLHTSNLYTVEVPEVVRDTHHPKKGSTPDAPPSTPHVPPLVSDTHHPSTPDAPEHNPLKEPLLTKSIKDKIFKIANSNLPLSQREQDVTYILMEDLSLDFNSARKLMKSSNIVFRKFKARG